MKIFERHNGNYEVSLGKLARATPKQTFATPAQAMNKRMKYGADWRDADICTNGAWYSASFNEVGGSIFGTRGEFNPLIDNAEQAVKAMRAGEFYLEGVLINGNPASKVLADIAEQDAKKPIYQRRVIDLGQTNTYEVPTDCFADDDTILFLAESKKRARDYGLFLRNKAGILQSKVYMQPIVGKDKSRGFWLYRLGEGYRSDFNCYNGDLNGDLGSVFGVREGAEGTQKISGAKVRAPSLSEILKYSKLFVPQAARADFERGLREKYKKQ